MIDLAQSMVDDSTTPLSKLLRAALVHLAADPGVQIAYLEGLGVAPSCDELALEFDDAMQSPASRDMTNASLHRLDDVLRAMSGEDRAALWDTAALRLAPEWQEVRMLARDALQELDRTVPVD